MVHGLLFLKDLLAWLGCPNISLITICILNKLRLASNTFLTLYLIVKSKVIMNKEKLIIWNKVSLIFHPNILIYRICSLVAHPIIPGFPEKKLPSIFCYHYARTRHGLIIKSFRWKPIFKNIGKISANKTCVFLCDRIKSLSLDNITQTR